MHPARTRRVARRRDGSGSKCAGTQLAQPGLQRRARRVPGETPGPLRRPVARETAPMEYESIRYEVEDRVATITLNRPEQLNALSPAMIRELREAYARAEADADVWLLLV